MDETTTGTSPFTPRNRLGLAAEAPGSRNDVAALAAGLTGAVGPFFSPGSARLRLGSSGQMYASEGAELESFSRQLWAVGSLLGGGFDAPLVERFAEGIVHGTDPEHPEFWGMDAPPMQQPCVERPAVAFALVEAGTAFWAPLPDGRRQRVFEWLDWINRCEIHANNWRFFRLLVNAAFHRLGLPVARERMAGDRELLESFYLGDGWFTDGASGRIDYYLPWAFHLYGILLHRWGVDEIPGMEGFGAAAVERAAAFAPEFAAWFDAAGRSVPFGRSLIYRFAQSSFWGLPALVEETLFPPGEAKGYLLRNLRWWCGRPILSDGGLLSLGYGYAQAGVTEAYNAPGSPYWSNKAFLSLLGPETHPFWTCGEALPGRSAGEIRAQKAMGWNLAGGGGEEPVVVLNGSVAAFDPENDFSRFADKYARLAYNSRTGFTMSGGGRGLGHAALDANLAVSLGGGLWRTRDNATLMEQDEESQWSMWEAGEGVEVLLWQGFFEGWLLRLFRLNTRIDGACAEGGWSVPAGNAKPGEPGTKVGGEGNPEAPYSGILLRGDSVATAILDPMGNRTVDVVDDFPNTNLIHPASRTPCLRFSFSPGIHYFASAQPLSFEPKTVDGLLAHAPCLEVEDATTFVFRGEGARRAAFDTVRFG